MADLDQHLAAIVAGDADAFARWMSAAEPELRRSLRSFAASVDCEAVLQEALLRVWQTAPRVVPDGRPDALLRFAVTVARNLARSEARRLRTLPTEPEALERAGATAPATEADPLLRETLARCRDELPAKPAEALAARLGGGWRDPDEVLAERLGMRLNTFLQNFTRARKLLADCLARRGVELATEWR